MELLTITIAAGETKRYERAGRYLEIFEAPNPCDVFLTDRQGGRVDYARGAQSGIFLEGAFGAIELYSATAQTVVMLITEGRGGSRRQPGNVRVIDELTDACQVNSGALPNAVTGWAFTQVIDPALNLRGVILRGLSLDCVAGATGIVSVRFMAAKSMPVGLNNPVQQFQLCRAAASNGGVGEESIDLMNKLLPVGWGLFAARTVQTVASVSINFQAFYEVL